MYLYGYEASWFKDSIYLPRLTLVGGRFEQNA